MAASGAKVLMLRAVELARSQDVPIHARSTFSNEPGTWIEGAEGLEQPIVSAVTHSEDEVVFELRGVPDRPGSAAAIFEAVAAEHVNVDTILQNVVHESAELSFSVPQDDVPATRRALERAQEAIGPIEIEEISDLGKVSLIGAGNALAPRRRGAHVPHARRRGDQPAPDLDLADQGLVPHPALGRRAGGASVCTRRFRSATQ